MSETMKAVRIHEYGGPEVLRYEDAPKPVAGPGQLLIRVAVAGVNPVDWKLRQGIMQSFWPLTLPATLGADFAGTVEAVGANVSAWKSGDVVWGGSSELGGYAEYIVVSEAAIAAKPDNISLKEAGGLYSVALTAWQGVHDHGRLQPGQTILIHAAAGGVGMFAVQFAKEAGAHVIGTASAKNEAFVRSLGVDSFIDYTSTRFEDAVQNADVVFDTVGGDTGTRSLAVLKSGGILVCIAGEPDRAEAARRGVTVEHFSMTLTPESLRAVSELVASGKVTTFISETFPLSEARAAQEASETGRTRGKIVLQVE
ncbi:MAG: NADP-dependent oxidoreductase [Akkermansiaceae bacterium]|nr:NADP-dependent oxidoreductase [Armatimonadota bacterium]